jgi:23S rRNA pseudouridine1911/1915/1917 synthase
MEWRTIVLDRGDHGVRVDRVLMRHLRDEKGMSRNRIQKWIDAGDVQINGTAPPRAAWRMQSGDDLRVRASAVPAKRDKPKPEALDIEVLYEDDELLAVNKPAGLVVHPSYGHASGTLMNGLLERARAWPTGSAPALLGRLDKLTSGIVIVSKRSTVHAALQRAMAANRMDKDYLAIVRGKPSPPCHGDRSRRTAFGDEIRTAGYHRELFTRAVPADYGKDPSDPRAPGGQRLADCRRCELWPHSW